MPVGGDAYHGDEDGELISFPIFFRLTMLLVDAIEAAIGSPVEAWPTSDLIILFAFDPTMPFALTNLQKICAFLMAITCLVVWHVNSLLLAATIPFPLSYNSLHTYTTFGHSLHRPPDVNNII